MSTNLYDWEREKLFIIFFFSILWDGEIIINVAMRQSFEIICRWHKIEVVQQTIFCFVQKVFFILIQFRTFHLRRLTNWRQFGPVQMVTVTVHRINRYFRSLDEWRLKAFGYSEDGLKTNNIILSLGNVYLCLTLSLYFYEIYLLCCTNLILQTFRICRAKKHLPAHHYDELLLSTSYYYIIIHCCQFNPIKSR